MLSSPIYDSSEFFITIIVIGSCVAVYYKRLTGSTPGGIVPIGASLILAIRNPLWSLLCVALSFVGYWFYLVSISRLDKRGGFPHVYSIAVITMVTGIATAYIMQWIGLIDIQGMTIGGLVVPAILANQYRLQGIKVTIRGFAFCISMTLALVVCLVYTANAFGASESLFAHFQVQHIPDESRYLKFYPLASLVSLIFGFFVYRKSCMRTGGYIMAPLAAQLLTSVNTSLIFVSGLIVLYLVQVLLTQYTLIIGLQRYLASIIFAAVFVWFSILFIQQGLSSQDATFLGSAWILVLVLASYSADLYVYRRKKSYIYVLLNTLIAYVLVIAFRVSATI